MMVSRRRTAALACTAGAVGVAAALYWILRLRQSRSSVLTPQLSSAGDGDITASDDPESSLLKNNCTVVVPILGLRFDDEEFARWTLSRHGVWYDYIAEDVTEGTPSGIVEFVLEGDPGQPLISIVAEDLMMMSSTAAEYVERSRQGLPTVEWELENTDVLEKTLHCEDVEPVDAQEQDSGNVWEDRVDTCCCAFTELAEWSRGQQMERCVINMVAIRLGIAVVLQLSCRDSNEEREKHMPVFRRICTATVRQLRSPNCSIAERSREHFVQFGLKSMRHDRPGVLMTLPVGCLQMLDPTTHPVALILYEKLMGSTGAVTNQPTTTHHLRGGSNSGGTPPAITSPHVQRTAPASMIACVEKRSRGFEETVETYLLLLHKKSVYQRVVQDFASVDVGRRSAVCRRDDLLCIVIAVAGTQGAANERARTVCEALKPYNQHKCCLQYLHMPSGISYSLPNAALAAPQPTFLTQFFGPLSFQAFPYGAASHQPSMRLSIREIRDGETLASLQREATKGYDERWINRRPSVDGWGILDVSLEAADGTRTMEYVTMLEHQGRFVHIVWNCPHGEGMTGMVDRNGCLHLNPVLL